MKNDLDEGLTLEGLLLALKAMDPETLLQVHFDTDTWRFYILHNAELSIMVPGDTVMISQGRPAAFYNSVCQIIALSKAHIKTR